MQLQFKSCYVAEIVEPNHVFLISEKNRHLLLGRLYCQIAPFLGGEGASSDEIVDKLVDVADAADIYYAIERLQAAGYLEEMGGGLSREIAAFCHHLGVSPKVAAERLEQHPISIHSFGKIDTAPLVALVSALGIQVVAEASEFQVVIVEDYLQEELASWNPQKPWMLLKPVGTEIWLGPLFIPSETGCWKCLESRLKHNRIEERYIQDRNGKRVSPTLAGLPHSVETAYHLAATEIFKKLVSDKASSLEGKLLSFDLTTMQMQEHHLTRLPQCSCSGGVKNEAKSIVLTSRKKREHRDGGYHTRSAEATLKKLEHHVSPILGITTFLNKIEMTKSDHLHVYHGGNNYALSARKKDVYHQDLRSSSAGKGKSEVQSKVSCLCESIERYCGIFQENEVRIRATYSDIRDQAIHPSKLLQFSERQYQMREETNQLAHPFHLVPERFSEEHVIEWTPVWSLTNQVHQYLPTGYCYYQYPWKEERFCLANSNGCAAGNCLEEAILQGFFELVERDSVALWWYNRIQMPFVDLTTFEDPYIASLLAEYQTLGRTVWVLDLTSDLQIPTFVAVSRRIEGENEEILFGFGTHLNAQVAIIRALTEMNQMVAMIPFLGELTDQSNITLKWVRTASVKDHPYLLPSQKVPAKVSSDYPLEPCDDLLDEIVFCRKIVEEKGMEMLVLDQSRPDIDLSVVKVIVPGLSHFWPRFAAKRLYDVPVEMGWLKTPLKEEDLNPIPMFL